jgi:hypothetical protein
MIVNIISTAADIVEITVGTVALYLAWTQREKISAAFSILFSHSLQISLADLRHWLETLDENNINGNDESKKVRTSLAHIFGKIKGNKILYSHFGDKMLKRLKVMIEDLDEGRGVQETSKVSLCSEIRESLATLEVENQKIKSRQKI